MPSDCIFCRLLAGDGEAEFVYRDEEVSAFWDRRPAAPVHILIVPNKHISSLNEAEEEDERLLGKLILTAKKLAKELEVEQSGYRLVINAGPDGGQTVFHLHVHLLAGKRLPVFECREGSG